MNGQGLLDRVGTVLRRRVRIDTRALAALRITLGALLLVDLARRAADLRAFYTDAGVVPREVLAALAPTFRQFSIHALWGSATAQAALFVVAGMFALAFLVGYRTKLATLVTFVLLVSLHIRNPEILNGGDSLLRHLLLWCLLLPMGERWSVDAVGDSSSRDSIASLATAGLLLQVAVVYMSNAVLKFRGDIWLRGEAVEQVMLLSRHSTWLGEALLDVPLVLTVANYLWLALLVCSPLLVVLTGWHRIVLPALFGAMHFGMVLLMQLGVFPLLSIAALLPFLPSRVWDRVPEPPQAVFRRLDAMLPRGPGWGFGMQTRLRSLTPAVAGLLLCAMVVVNAGAVGAIQYPAGTPDAVENKAWDMFAPRPPADNGWYVAPATLESGRQIDALQQDTLTWDRPPDADTTFANERWRKLLYQLRGTPEHRLQRPLAQYLCQRWNQSHEDDIEEVRLVYNEYSPRDRERGDRIELGRWSCA